MHKTEPRMNPQGATEPRLKLEDEGRNYLCTLSKVILGITTLYVNRFGAYDTNKMLGQNAGSWVYVFMLTKLLNDDGKNHISGFGIDESAKYTKTGLRKP